jgi:hypothetical protein
VEDNGRTVLSTVVVDSGDSRTGVARPPASRRAPPSRLSTTRVFWTYVAVALTFVPVTVALGP